MRRHGSPYSPGTWGSRLSETPQFEQYSATGCTSHARQLPQLLAILTPQHDEYVSAESPGAPHPVHSALIGPHSLDNGGPPICLLMVISYEA